MFGSSRANLHYTYVGEFYRGKRHGEGTEQYRDGSSYVGQYYQGFREGKGLYTHHTGSHFRGDFRGDKFHGQGIFTWMEDDCDDVAEEGEGVWVTTEIIGCNRFVPGSNFVSGEIQTGFACPRYFTRRVHVTSTRQYGRRAGFGYYFIEDFPDISPPEQKVLSSNICARADARRSKANHRDQ